MTASEPLRADQAEGADLMPAYMIVQIKITREDGWPEYREQVSRLFAAHGGRYLVRGGQVEVLEGSHDGRRLVVFEFPSMEVIRSVWNSPEYERVKRLREGSGELDVWAVPGG
jgi:uncharacterized protein (DUF1330 family)